MIEYKGYSYPTVEEAIEYYKVPGGIGGFSNSEREAKNFFVHLPIGINVCIDGVDKDNLMDLYNTDGTIVDEDLKRCVQDKIDKVCTDIYDSIINGDIDI